MTSCVMLETCMRAARLLHCLLLLQNRGRMTSVELARELEVSPRTILRDVDAMTEAGLPIIVHQGNRGGIELGFDYRLKLTGLTTEEADALAVVLNLPLHELDAIGLGTAGRVALSKLREVLPAPTAERVGVTERHFSIRAGVMPEDPRVPAMAEAVRYRRVVRLQARSPSPRVIHPCHLMLGRESCSVFCETAPGVEIPLSGWGDVNISLKRVF